MTSFPVYIHVWRESLEQCQKHVTFVRKLDTLSVLSYEAIVFMVNKRKRQFVYFSKEVADILCLLKSRRWSHVE